MHQPKWDRTLPASKDFPSTSFFPSTQPEHPLRSHRLALIRGEGKALGPLASGLGAATRPTSVSGDFGCDGRRGSDVTPGLGEDVPEAREGGLSQGGVSH